MDRPDHRHVFTYDILKETGNGFKYLFVINIRRTVKRYNSKIVILRNRKASFEQQIFLNDISDG